MEEKRREAEIICTAESLFNYINGGWRNGPMLPEGTIPEGARLESACVSEGSEIIRWFVEHPSFRALGAYENAPILFRNDQKERCKDAS